MIKQILKPFNLQNKFRKKGMFSPIRSLFWRGQYRLFLWVYFLNHFLFPTLSKRFYFVYHCSQPIMALHLQDYGLYFGQSSHSFCSFKYLSNSVPLPFRSSFGQPSSFPSLPHLGCYPSQPFHLFQLSSNSTTPLPASKLNSSYLHLHWSFVAHCHSKIFFIRASRKM